MVLMGHSSQSSNGVLDILKMFFLKIFQLVFLVVSLCFGIVGAILTSISQFFKNISEK